MLELVAQLQAHVKGKLAPYEYPKEIEFMEALPMTTTGKVQRRVLRLQEESAAAAGGLKCSSRRNRKLIGCINHAPSPAP